MSLPVEIEEVTPAMRQAGDDVAGLMISARCCSDMAGLGGCRTLDALMTENPGPYTDIVLAYAKREIDSVTGIFIAMLRAKEVKT